MSGMSVNFPPALRPPQPPFGGNDHPLVLRPGTQRTGDQSLVVADLTVIEAIDVRGVDDGDPGVEHRLNAPDALLSRGAILNRQMHPAISNGSDRWGIDAELPERNHAPSAR